MFHVLFNGSDHETAIIQLFKSEKLFMKKLRMSAIVFFTTITLFLLSSCDIEESVEAEAIKQENTAIQYRERLKELEDNLKIDYSFSYGSASKTTSKSNRYYIDSDNSLVIYEYFVSTPYRSYEAIEKFEIWPISGTIEDGWTIYEYNMYNNKFSSKDYHVENHDEKGKVVKVGVKDGKVHEHQDEDSKRITTELIEYMNALNDDRIMILFDNYDKAVENMNIKSAD